MKQQEFTEKRWQMQEKKKAAENKIGAVLKLFIDAKIEDWMVTGSQALIVQGFMFHRNGGDVDVRVRIPNDEKKKTELLYKFSTWSMLYPVENRNTYKGSTVQQFTFYKGNVKINVLAMTAEEYDAIPYNWVHNEYSVETVGSVLLDKLNLNRDKDYEDFVKCVNNLSNVCL